MFRIGLKFPCNGLNRVKKNTYSRLYLTARCYETRSRAKCVPDGRLSKDAKLMSRYSGLKYSTGSQRSEKSGGSSTALVTLGAITLGTLGVLSYAKSNSEFRATLEGWVPGTDKTIQIIFQEESSYFEFIRTFFETLKKTIITNLFGDSSDNKSAPKPAFEPLVAKKKEPINEPYFEIRLSQDKGEGIEVVAEKPVPPSQNIPKELMPENLVELETLCRETAAKAIKEYQKAACAVQEYNENVIRVVESSTTVGNAVWDRLKEATEKRKESLREAEEHASQALNSLKRMYNLIDDPKLDAPAPMKSTARRNIKQIMDDVDGAKLTYQKELQNGNIAERYWKQVKTARDNLNEELCILFPNFNIKEKKFTLNEEAFDLFVVHMYHKVNMFQKELEKLRTVGEAKIRASLKATGGENMTDEKLDALVCVELGRQKQALENEFSKKLLAEQKKFDDELRRQLKLQSQIHADHLREALSVKEGESERMMKRALSEQSEADALKHKAQLATIVGRLRGLETALKSRMEEERGASNAQILWSACQALARAVKSAPPGAPVEQAVRPLEAEIKAVCKAAPKEDPLVRAALQGIPEEAAKRGVYPEDALRERFLKVENVARRLAMVPEQGAALPIYILSYIQNFLTIKTMNPIPRSELEDEPIDAQSLNTYDILHRARYWLDRGDFKMTLRYMNLLKGAPRSIARDWMHEAKILLETQQAVETLLAYAGAIGLVFLGAGDSKKETE